MVLEPISRSYVRVSALIGALHCATVSTTKYPANISSTQSFLYRYSWDEEDLKTYPWDSHYLQANEILGYLKHVVNKYNLRKHFQFKTELLSAQWSDEERRWIVMLSANEVLKVKYLVTGLGLLSKTNFPNIPNLDKYEVIVRSMIDLNHEPHEEIIAF